MKKTGILAMVIFLVGVVGSVSAATLDLPKWVIVPEDALNFADITLFCSFDTMDTVNNVTVCYLNGGEVNATIYFNTTTGYPKLVTGKIKSAFEFDGNTGELVQVSGINIATTETEEMSYALWLKQQQSYDSGWVLALKYGAAWIGGIIISQDTIIINVIDNAGWHTVLAVPYSPGKWYFIAFVETASEARAVVYDEDGNRYEASIQLTNPNLLTYNVTTVNLGSDWAGAVAILGAIDEFRLYDRALTDDEIKLLYLAGRKKLSELANFRQISSPFIDIFRDRATFYAGLEVSTSDPNGYVPVPESAVNMSITSAPKLVSDYTGVPFYYQGHYWYRADKIQFNLPIQFETVREKGGFSKTVLLNEDKKTFVYEKEFKVTNPTATRLNVVYSVDPTSLGFSVLQYPQFEIDGIRMAEWRPSNSSTLYLISTDSLEPGEISTHWIRSVWTISKEELEFPAKLDDFRSITDWTVAQRMAENAIKGKTDTYVKVIKIDSNADVSNVTVLVPLNVEDEDDVIEAVALTGSRETLQIERLDDGKIVVKVPADAFVSGHAEIKVLYNKSDSWFSNLLEKIRSLMRKILSLFGLGGG